MHQPSEHHPSRRFKLGHMVVTPAASAALEVADLHDVMLLARAVLKEASLRPATLLLRDLSGDWGDFNPHEWKLNDEALLTGERLLSCYGLATGQTVWVATVSVTSDFPHSQA